MLTLKVDEEEEEDEGEDCCNVCLGCPTLAMVWILLKVLILNGSSMKDVFWADCGNGPKAANDHICFVHHDLDAFRTAVFPQTFTTSASANWCGDMSSFPMNHYGQLIGCYEWPPPNVLPYEWPLVYDRALFIVVSNKLNYSIERINEYHYKLSESDYQQLDLRYSFRNWTFDEFSQIRNDYYLKHVDSDYHPFPIRYTMMAWFKYFLLIFTIFHLLLLIRIKRTNP